MKPTKAKAVAIYAVMVVLLCLTAVVLFWLDYDQWKAKELSLCQIKLDSTAETMRIMEDLQKSSKASYDRHRQDNLGFMTATLAGYITENGYTGPRLFDDGAVVELRANQVLWPEGIPDGFPTLSPEDVRQGRQLEASIPSVKASGAAASDTDEKSVLLMSGRIGGDYYYVDWTNVDDIPGNQYAGLSDEDFLNNAAEPFDGALLLVSTEEESLPIIHESGTYPETVNAAELGLTRELIEQRCANLKIGGISSLCVYSELREGAEALIFVMPFRALFMRCLPHVVMVEVSALIIIVTLCHYLLSVFRYIRGHRLTKKQARRYHPKQLRRTVITAGLTGALVIFISTAVFQTLDALHEESIIGAKSFNCLFEKLQNTTMDRLAYEKQREAEWYVYYGNQIASLISRNPEAGSRERLQEYCDQLGFDYIMLFDSDGKEIACNADYAGFTMDNGLGENSRDFRRLLMGVPSVVHDVSVDSITGLTRQFIGVKVPSSSGSGNTPHGALVMAIRPWQSQMNEDEMMQWLHLIESRDILVCYAESETGRILYANDASLPGKTVMEYGLPEKSLSNGYTDFVTLQGIQSYVTTVKQSDVVFIYVIKRSVLFSNTLPASLAATVAYLFVLCVVLAICLRKYDESDFSECIGADEWQSEDTSAATAQAEKEPEEKESRGLSELLLNKNRKKVAKEDRTPENWIKGAIRFDIILLILLPALFSLKDGGASVGNGTLIQFLLYGDWNRGLNLFALCSIIIVLLTGTVLVILSNGILSLIAGFTGKGGETFCRLLYSLVNYIVVLGTLYYVFEYVGLPISTYIASLSVVSLALSLGAKDMVSDILAGLLIVFESQFQVGDIVEIDGIQGEVLEIGVRSTRLLNIDNDVNYFTNSMIRSIVNKSKRDSAYTVRVKIVSQDSMEQVEAFFKRELPKIGNKLGTIVSGPMLSEITILSSAGELRSKKIYNIGIKTTCKAEDFYSVRDFVNHEVYLLFDRENIRLWESICCSFPTTPLPDNNEARK